MIAANAYLNIDDFYWHNGKEPRPLPDRDGYGLHALYRLYRAKTGWVFLACPFEEEWEALCRAIDRPDLRDDPRFATREARENHDDALADQLARVFAAGEPMYWEKLLTAADVACVKAEDRGMYFFPTKTPMCVRTACLPKWRRRAMASSGVTLPWSASRIPLAEQARVRSKASTPGLSSKSWGYTDEQVHDLKQRKVVDWEEE